MEALESTDGNEAVFNKITKDMKQMRPKTKSTVDFLLFRRY